MIGTIQERQRELNELYPVWISETQWERFFRISCRFSESIFLIDDEGTYTYCDVRRKTEELSKILFLAGIRTNDIIGISLGNSLDFICSVLAVSRLGGCSVLINNKVSLPEQLYMLEKAEASFLITEQNSETVLKNLQTSQISSFCRDNVDADSENTFREMISLVKFDAERMTTVIFTSGSTSRPKGVILTDDILLRSSFATVNTRHMETGRRIYVPIPLCHAMGYVEAFLSAMTVGGSIVISKKRYSAAEHMERMLKFRVNDIVCVSSIMIRMMSDTADFKGTFSDLHAAYWAGLCPAWVYEKAERVFDIDDCGNGYGLTECGSTSHLMGPEDIHDLKPYFCGALKKAGAAETEAGTGNILKLRIDPGSSGEQCGEILLKGSCVTPGYINDPESTAEKIDSDGWFHTGDIGKLDEHGYLSFLGRTDEMFKVNGENVSPAYVEEVLNRDPEVSEVYVVGVPHERCGQVGAAFVKFAERTAGTVENVRCFAEKNLAVFQRPLYIFEFQEGTLPKTMTGKVSRKLLKEEAENRIKEYE